uniref:GPI ethanolamine phosphate transferase 1 n=1 Tax=Periophthalmus magnuspinnatus TaxID=409849 RepID=A0A3B3ZWC2_9GOBI
MLSVGLAALSLWPFLSEVFEKAKVRSMSWFLSCLCLAVFPLLPVVGREPNLHLVSCAGLLALFTSFCFLWSSRRRTPLHHSETRLLLIQMIHVAVCAFVPSLTHSSLQQKRGLPLLSQIISWTTLGSSILIPLLSSTRLFHRLLSILLSLTATYLLLSTGSEALFPPALSWLMFVWIKMEQEALLTQRVSGRQEVLCSVDFAANIDITKIRQLKLDDIRRSYFFVFFIITAFFGTGNIASINSFDPASVYCFLTVFNPFIMGGLMMWKVIIPFIIVMCFINDLINYGSWLDIGTSISHYVIVMSMTIFLMILSVVTHILTSQRLVLWRKSKIHYP